MYVRSKLVYNDMYLVLTVCSVIVFRKRAVYLRCLTSRHRITREIVWRRMVAQRLAKSNFVREESQIKESRRCTLGSATYVDAGDQRVSSKSASVKRIRGKKLSKSNSDDEERMRDRACWHRISDRQRGLVLNCIFVELQFA